MASDAEKVKERLDIVEVISGYVKLQKAGTSFKGLSPFTQEKTPSFFVSPERQTYYCFSTNKGGDVFTFIEEMEGLDFRGALKLLADRAGVELTNERVAGDTDTKERLFAALDEACIFYQHELAKQKDAHDYLHKRGVEDKTIALWRIGFAPAAWEALKIHLFEKKFTEQELLDAGLIKKGEKGTTYDRFRSRIVFPIKDSVGRVVGFSARHFGAESEDTAKYLNSPEGVLYDKSRILFGFDTAKQGIKKHDFAIFVEGQMDAVMVYQAGFHNVVAVSGTALTQAHVTQIERISKNVLLAFDADRAGIASALRAAGLLLPRGIEVKVVTLHGDKDPADSILHDGVDAWKKSVREAKHLIFWYMDLLEKNIQDERKREKAVREHLLPHIARMQNAMDRAHFSKKVAERLKLPENAVSAEVTALQRSQTGAPQRVASDSAASVPVPAITKKEILQRLDMLKRKLVGILLLLETQAQEDHATLRADILAALPNEVREKYTPEKDRLLFEVEHSLEGSDANNYGREVLRDFIREQTKEEYQHILLALQHAEVRGQTEEIEKLLQSLNEQRQRIAALDSFE